MDHELTEYINSFDIELAQFAKVIAETDDPTRRIAACIRKAEELGHSTGRTLSHLSPTQRGILRERFVDKIISLCGA